MALNVEKLLSDLNRMTVTELRREYAEAFGEPTRSYNKAYLIRRIAWRKQAIVEGDLPERARRRALEIANDADLRMRAPSPGSTSDASANQTDDESVERPFTVPLDERLPMPGALLTREYKGRTIEVRVMPNGFDYEGTIYRSLSAVARAVTGSHWNGYLFFRIPQPNKETQ